MTQRENDENCYKFANEWSAQVMLVFFYIQCCLTSLFGLYSIFGFYLKHQMPKPLKYGSIFVSLCLIFGCLAWAGYWHVTYLCFQQNFYLFQNLFGSIATMSGSFSMIVWYALFCARTIAALQNTVFAVSRTFEWCLIVPIIIMLLLVIISIFVIVTSVNSTAVTGTLSSSFFMLYLVMNCVLLYSLIKKFYFILKASVAASKYFKSENNHISVPGTSTTATSSPTAELAQNTASLASVSSASSDASAAGRSTQSFREVGLVAADTRDKNEDQVHAFMMSVLAMEKNDIVEKLGHVSDLRLQQSIEIMGTMMRVFVCVMVSVAANFVVVVSFALLGAGVLGDLGRPFLGYIMVANGFVDNLSLLCQYGFGARLYYKWCKPFDRCVKRICVRRAERSAHTV